ncbi:hypothetical protein [Aquimarina agarivorans]|uniref:DUF7935 family protein n=1 Tax=Aquimarina agarivorans TaxID=980584 RepID=UPI0002D44EAA|nr:hypothetical protein [Aquimarina agarivorans]
MKIDIYLVILVIIPAIVVALVCFYSIQSMLKKELMKQKYNLLKSTQKETLPLKLQAYERFTLLLDRISLDKLLVRVSPNGEDKNGYKNLLIATIEQEFEHNLTQQIYISEECWKTILTAKNTVISQLHTLSVKEGVDNAAIYRNEGIAQFPSSTSPTNIAQAFVRSEVSLLFR